MEWKKRKSTRNSIGLVSQLSKTLHDSIGTKISKREEVEKEQVENT